MDMETKIDGKGRVVIPQPARKRLGIKEGTVLSVEEKEGGILLKPERGKKRNIEDFFALKVERTGDPEWATPKEMKGIWE